MHAPCHQNENMAGYRSVSLVFSAILAFSVAQTDQSLPNYDVTAHGDRCLYSLLAEKPEGGCRETYSPQKQLMVMQNHINNMDEAIDKSEERHTEAHTANRNKLLEEEKASLTAENEIKEIEIHTEGLEKSNDNLNERLQEQTAKMRQLQNQISTLSTAISRLLDEEMETDSDPAGTTGPPPTSAGPQEPTGTSRPTPTFRDCTELKKEKPGAESGVKTMALPDGQEYTAYCDFTSPNGPWTVIQRRQKADDNKQVDFFKTWEEYKTGFGDPSGEYWIGNHALHQLTGNTDYELRVELHATGNDQAHAHYDMFTVSGEESNYQLKLGRYTGTAGDALYVHRDRPFSTRDRDHDALASGSCARAYRGGWWYAKCFDANLNGEYSEDAEANLSSVSWVPWRGYQPVPRVEMKIRPKQAEASDSLP